MKTLPNRSSSLRVQGRRAERLGRPEGCYPPLRAAGEKVTLVHDALPQAGASRTMSAASELSGFSKFSGERHRHADVHPLIEAPIAAFTLDVCMWGSDSAVPPSRRAD